MKYLKGFKNYESVIIPDKLVSDFEIRNFDDLVNYGIANEFDVLLYNEFYNSLSDKNKKSAPPSHAPFFALFDPIKKDQHLLLVSLD
jgi:hypothetical protein